MQKVLRISKQRGVLLEKENISIEKLERNCRLKHKKRQFGLNVLNMAMDSKNGLKDFIDEMKRNKGEKDIKSFGNIGKNYSLNQKVDELFKGKTKTSSIYVDDVDPENKENILLLIAKNRILSYSYNY